MALGIIGLPIPDETILTFAGYLVSQNKLHLLPTVISSFLVSICGISISFIIGKTIGLRFLHRMAVISILLKTDYIKPKHGLKVMENGCFCLGILFRVYGM